MASNADTIAKVYARSIFELAHDAGGQEKTLEVTDELEQVVELMRGDERFARFIESPVVNAARRATSIRSIFENRISDLTLRFMLVLNTNGRLGHLDAVHEALVDLVHEAMGRVEVDVWTATEMNDATRQQVTEGLRGVLGKDPVVHAWVDPSILGGLKIRVGDKLVDGTVASRLRQLEHSIRSGAAHRIAASTDSFTEGAPSTAKETGPTSTGQES
ncbi:MAG: ATP synthase F1 subunit delta [Phycisphaerales bacterium]|nr:ATP synthase F1 subunit delta [Phycisphaerales bacterium]